MWILIVIALLFAILESLALWKGWQKLEMVVKPGVAILMLVWLSQTAGLHGPPLWFGIGLLFSAAGDLALIFIDRLFIQGLVAFLLAHIAYLVGFNIPLPEFNGWGPFVAIVIGLTALRLVRPIVNGVRARGQDRLVVPVIVYSTVITLMLLAAFLTLFRSGWHLPAALTVSLGALLFFVSDVILAWNRFVAPIKNGRMINIGLYHLAQIILIVGVGLQFS
ncbi:MAG: lysoplasmalogenase [Anaerolineales bacterium]|nr:lysoplasmalogenase [Anaerolineales bacterium]